MTWPTYDDGSGTTVLARLMAIQSLLQQCQGYIDSLKASTMLCILEVSGSNHKSSGGEHDNDRKCYRDLYYGPAITIPPNNDARDHGAHQFVDAAVRALENALAELEHTGGGGG